VRRENDRVPSQYQSFLKCRHFHSSQSKETQTQRFLGGLSTGGTRYLDYNVYKGLQV
jgi:hypothetical protein